MTSILIALYLFFSPLHVPDMSHRWPMLTVAAEARAFQVTYAGEPDEYPDGAYCTPNGTNFKGLQTPDNPCKCHLVMRSATNDGCCEILQANDAVCKQFCHEHHCACPRECVKNE
jgi:hypothetical protein